jgi:DNA replication protein DnaC
MTNSAEIQTLDTQPTDQQLQDKLTRIRLHADVSETHLASAPLPTLRPTGRCIRCQISLPESRQIQCAVCDEAVAGTLRQRELRDAADALYSRLRDSGLPINYRTGSRSIGDLPVSISPMISACNCLGKTVSGLYLYGRAGTFKTSLAAAYLAQQIRAGISGRYVFVPDLFADIHASYNAASGDTRAEIIRRCLSAPALVLDDLGKEKASEHAAGVLLEILDARYRNARAGDWLIVTSNWDLDALCARWPSKEFSDPIQRRLSELTVANAMEAA